MLDKVGNKLEKFDYVAFADGIRNILCIGKVETIVESPMERIRITYTQDSLSGESKTIRSWKDPSNIVKIQKPLD